MFSGSARGLMDFLFCFAYGVGRVVDFRLIHAFSGIFIRVFLLSDVVLYFFWFEKLGF